MSEIEILLRELFGPPTRGHRYRPTPEQLEQNRREIVIQNERDERAYRNAHPDNARSDSTSSADREKL